MTLLFILIPIAIVVLIIISIRNGLIAKKIRLSMLMGR